MPDRAVPTPAAAEDELFPRPVRPRVFALLWVLLLVLSTVLTILVVLYVSANGR
jgi:hypothetical protein